ncbi:amino acid kinase family-domain-containing protein [Obelidium mucronatum]|nr:amino acid kinase family-domain-containing protein [Obelidium mucronatum]
MKLKVGKQLDSQLHTDNQVPTYLIKLGGAAITAKDSNSFALIDSVIDSALLQVSRFLKETKSQVRIAIVCGVGPFGHTNVIRYGIKEGVYTDLQKEGLQATKEACDYVGISVTESAKQMGLDAVFVPGYAIARQNHKEVSWFDTEYITNLLNQGKVPVTTGSMVPDSSLNWSVMSGDEFISQLTLALKPERIFLGTNVDGIFTCDPNLNPKEAELIPSIGSSNIKHVLRDSVSGSAAIADVTGGMQGKLEKLAISIGLSTAIVFNLSLENNLYLGLCDGHIPKSTVIDMKP